MQSGAAGGRPGRRTAPRRRAARSAGAVVAVFTASSVAAVAHADPSPAALPPELVLEVQIAGTAGVPADAEGAVVNVTVTRAAQPGFVAVFPCTERLPETSNLNFSAGVDAANTVLAPLSADGAICIVTSAVTDVIVDVFGYVPAGSPIELLDVPVRGLDTRSGLGVGQAGPVAAGSRVVFDATAVPGGADAAALALNVTATGPAEAGFVTVGSCDGQPPTTSTLNFTAGRDVANLSVSAIDDDGTVCLTTSTATHLVVDVAGRIGEGAVDPVLLPNPARVVDSRNGTGSPPTPWAAGETRTLSIDTGATVSSTAFLNVTATRATAAGFVALHPCGVAPEGSNVNFVPGVDVANVAIVALAADGTVCATASAEVDLVVDHAGGSTDAATLVTFDAVRVHDSRAEAARGCGLGIVHPAHDTLWVVDLETGQFAATVTSEQFVPFFEPRFEFLPAAITPTCDALVVASAIRDDPDTARALRVTFDGTITELGTLEYDSRPSIAVLADGTAVWIVYNQFVGGALIEVSSGSPLFESDSPAYIRQVLDDAVVLTGDAGWVIADPAGIEPPRSAPALGVVSPGARYQMIEPLYRGDPITVVALDGRRVRVRDLADLADPADYFWTAVWIDDGVLALCARGFPTRAFVWNIFSEPVELPVAACVLGGR